MKDISFLKQSLIAHKGYYTDLIPENSLGAFRKAIIFNYIIELDVHLTKDKKVVVFHDHNLKRMTGIDRNIKDATLEELNNYYLLNTNYKIPTLKETLTLVNNKVPIIIELKLDKVVSELEKEVVKILDNYNGKYTITSFNPLSVLWFRIFKPNYIRGYLIPYDYKLLKGILFYNLCKPNYLSCNYKYYDDKRITKIKNKKIVVGWTIDNRKQYIKVVNYFDNLVCDIYKLNI